MIMRIILCLTICLLFCFCSDDPVDNNCGATNFWYIYNNPINQIIINWEAINAASFTASATINGSQTATGSSSNSFATLNGMFPGDSIAIIITTTCDNGLMSDTATFELVVP